MEQSTVTTKVQGNVPAAEPSHTTDDITPVSNYFKLSQPDPDQSMKMTTIAKYLRGDRQEYTQIDITRDLRDFMFKLGTPPLGGSTLDHAYNYAKIVRNIRDLEAEREKYLR